MNEKNLITRYFSTLNKNIASNLTIHKSIGDDCAEFEIPSGYKLVTSSDIYINDIHFLSSMNIKDIINRCFNASFSDLAANGANPSAFSLMLATPKKNAQWFRQLSLALKKQMQLFNVELIGGDITQSINLTLAFQVYGINLTHEQYYRSIAKENDAIFVSGTLGDSYLGLCLLQNKIKSADAQNKKKLIQKFCNPLARIELMLQIKFFVNCAIDISDGLFNELEHLTQNSNLDAQIDFKKIPYSINALSCMNENALVLADIINQGDDYELIISVPHHKIIQFNQFISQHNLDLTQIGIFTSKKQTKPKVRIENTNEKKINFTGYQHNVL